MAFFKQKIEFPQFIANLISHQFDFLERNSQKLIDLADERSSLTEQEKKDIRDPSFEHIPKK